MLFKQTGCAIRLISSRDWQENSHFIMNMAKLRKEQSDLRLPRVSICL
ncbi:hypothetical protein PREVCOP_03802 [Segatella copri DSM 18205]|uniref:Uncharacterized protein n=1 Tax=Segatella copri DSM 18205 TaxID=537011 RepID=D1P9B2_9BACT|nr:hypothetical protein PREVCOP_03802 [Segatella copri DSM 18205]